MLATFSWWNCKFKGITLKYCTHLSDSIRILKKWTWTWPKNSSDHISSQFITSSIWFIIVKVYVIFSEINTHSYIRYFMKLFYKSENEWIWKSQVHHTTIWYSWQQVCVAFKWGISTFPNKKLMLGNNKEQSYKSRWNSPKFHTHIHRT